MTTITRLLTNQDNLAESRLETVECGALAEGQARLRIHRLALTANNITYAAFGHTPHLRYWHYFPVADQGWGQMPAWGFAEVEETTVEGLEPGERFYGFWPLASHLVVEPVRVTERGFYDGAAHRLDLVSAYNQYQRIRTDAAYRPENENYQMLLRPLFITSFMLADFLEDNGFFGAKRVLISSASSKTAYGTVFCLQDRQELEVVGLTSSGNTGFVEGLGCYDRVVDYNDLTSLDPNVPTLYVDFSGNDGVRATIHRHMTDNLVHNCYAGSAHNHEHISETEWNLPGPAPKRYFAPDQIRKRNADWGPAEVTRRFNKAQLAFIERVGQQESPWMEIRDHQGLESAQALIRSLVEGNVNPADGHVVVLAE